jgi:uncharacterized protein (UPF0333 family)
MRRAQAAIEYLIILAVVVIIAIGVIGGFPGMTKGVSQSSSAAYWSSADIAITRYYVKGAVGSLSQFVIRNNRLFSVNFTGIGVNGGANVLNYTTGVVLAPGASALVNLTNLTASATPCTTGLSYSLTINMSYTDATYGTPYAFTGDVPLVGTCQ